MKAALVPVSFASQMSSPWGPIPCTADAERCERMRDLEVFVDAGIEGEGDAAVAVRRQAVFGQWTAARTSAGQSWSETMAT